MPKKKKVVKKVAKKEVPVAESTDNVLTFVPPKKGTGIVNADVVIEGK